MRVRAGAGAEVTVTVTVTATVTVTVRSRLRIRGRASLSPRQPYLSSSLLNTLGGGMLAAEKAAVPAACAFADADAPATALSAVPEGCPMSAPAMTLLAVHERGNRLPIPRSPLPVLV